jgi:signal transduction histidine kinase
MDTPNYPENNFSAPEDGSNEEPLNNSFLPQQPNQTEFSQEIQHLENELHLTLEEIARLQNALAEANMKLMAANSSTASQEYSISAISLIQPMVKELRQPLVTIRGYLALLLNESVGPLGAFQRRFVERIQKSVDHIEESFENILHNRLKEKNEPGIYSQSFSLRKSTEAALDLFIGSIKTKDILLKINIPYEDIRLFADKENFENILNLILTNATVALENNGNLSIAIEELLTQAPQEVVITVESSEHNVAPVELIPVLPEMYKNQNLTLPGFGLPLEDIVRANELTSGMGGKLDLYSNSCGVTVAKVRLPLVQGETL